MDGEGGKKGTSDGLEMEKFSEKREIEGIIYILSVVRGLEQKIQGKKDNSIIFIFESGFRYNFHMGSGFSPYGLGCGQCQ